MRDCKDCHAAALREHNRREAARKRVHGDEEEKKKRLDQLKKARALAEKREDPETPLKNK